MKLRSLSALFASLTPLLLVPSDANAIRLYENEENGTSFNVGGYIQPYLRWVDDGCIPTGDPATGCNLNLTQDGFGIDRARVSFNGNVHGIADFNLELNAVPTVDLLEANVTFEIVEALELEFGIFKVPVQRGDLVSESRRQFIARAESIRPAPGRQLGAALSYGLPESLTGLPDGFIFATVGIFNGERSAERPPVNNIDERFLTVARLEFNPFGRPSRLVEGDLRDPEDRSEPILSIAGAFAHNRNDNEDWEQDNFVTDLFFAWYGFSLYADYHRANRNFFSDEAGADQYAAGFNAQIGYFIPAPYVDEHLEIVARVEQFDPRTAAREEDAPDLLPVSPLGGPAAGSAAEQEQLGIHGGINWYFAGHDLKLQTQYVHRIGTEDWRLSADDAAIENEFADDTFYAQLTYRF